MMRLAIQLVSLIVLLAGAATLFAQLSETIESQSIATPATTSGQSPALIVRQKLGEFQPPLPSAFPQTLSRPAFFDGRAFPTSKPKQTQLTLPKPPTEVAVPTKPTLPIDKIKLLGLHVELDVQRALLEITPGSAAWRTVGEKIDAWAIISIDVGGVTLKAGSQTGKLELYRSLGR